MNLHPELTVPLALVGAAALVDLRRREIPDLLPVLVLVWAAVSALAGWSPVGLLPAGLGLLAGFVAGAVLWRMGGLGGGDVKLLAALGAALGPLGLLLALRWIALSGGVLALIARARGRADLAYGPAIAFGLAVHACLAWNEVARVLPA